MKTPVRIKHNLSNKDLVERLNKISGQVKGVSGMLKENRSCLAIVQQIIAARNALGKVAAKLLTQESCKKETRQNRQKFEKIVDNLIDLQ